MAFASNFHNSATNIRIEGRSWLKAYLTNEDGEQIEAAIDLNSCLGNNGDFAYSVDPDEDIYVSLEGGDQVPVLRAHLADSAGNYNWRDVNLAERIGNDNGEFYFQ